MNRTSGKIELFEDSGDYEAFERVLTEALKREPAMRLCAYCLMPKRGKGVKRPLFGLLFLFGPADGPERTLDP